MHNEHTDKKSLLCKGMYRNDTKKQISLHLYLKVREQLCYCVLSEWSTQGPPPTVPTITDLVPLLPSAPIGSQHLGFRKIFKVFQGL